MADSNPMPTHGKFINLTGHVYGRLTVKSFIARVGKHSFWLCECSCGNEKKTSTNNLRCGNTTSCGCYIREITAKRSTTHGHTKGGKNTYEYTSWRHMIERCLDQKCKNYADYGGRGITVCQKWVDSFEAFFADVGPRPAGLQLDRIDNNLGYEPGNVRWTTRAVQCRNRRSNHFVTHDGKTMCLKDWAEHFGIHYLTAWKRINWHGWSFIDAMTTPVRQSTKTK